MTSLYLDNPPKENLNYLPETIVFQVSYFEYIYFLITKHIFNCKRYTKNKQKNKKNYLNILKEIKSYMLLILSCVIYYLFHTHTTYVRR